jgi:rhodanese-related sulfurtransferase
MSIPDISVQELEALIAAKADVFILDVRNQDEYEICNIEGHLIPFKELPHVCKNSIPSSILWCIAMRVGALRVRLNTFSNKDSKRFKTCVAE